MGIMPAATSPSGSPVAMPIYIVDQNGNTGGSAVGIMPAAKSPSGSPVAMPIYIVDQNGQPSGVSPVIIANDASTLLDASATVTANIVYLWAFELQTALVIASLEWGMKATVTGTTNMGIYTFAGNLVAGSDTGAKTNVASSTNISTYVTAIQLALGQYYLALACSNATDTYLGKLLSNAFTTSRYRRAANALSAGALPLTLGAVSATTVTLAMAAAPVGGLS